LHTKTKQSCRANGSILCADVLFPGNCPDYPKAVPLAIKPFCLRAKRSAVLGSACKPPRLAYRAISVRPTDALVRASSLAVSLRRSRPSKHLSLFRYCPNDARARSLGGRSRPCPASAHTAISDNTPARTLTAGVLCSGPDSSRTLSYSAFLIVFHSPVGNWRTKCLQSRRLSLC
jgi:hypothetical protein